MTAQGLSLKDLRNALVKIETRMVELNALALQLKQQMQSRRHERCQVHVQVQHAGGVGKRFEVQITPATACPPGTRKVLQAQGADKLVAAIELESADCKVMIMAVDERTNAEECVCEVAVPKKVGETAQESCTVGTASSDVQQIIQVGVTTWVDEMLKMMEVMQELEYLKQRRIKLTAAQHALFNPGKAGHSALGGAASGGPPRAGGRPAPRGFFGRVKASCLTGLSFVLVNANTLAWFGTAFLFEFRKVVGFFGGSYFIYSMGHHLDA